MLAGPDPLVILYMPCDSTQDDLLHQLPRHRGLQSWTQYSRWGLTRAEQRGRITSLDLLATLLFMQPRIWLAFWAASAHCQLTSSFSSTSTPKSFSAGLLSIPSSLKPVLILGITLTQLQDPALGLVEPQEVHMGALLELVQVPLDGIPSFRHVNRTTQLGVCKLAEGALDATSPGTSPDCHGISNIMERGLATRAANSLRTLGCISSGPIDLRLKLAKCTLRRLRLWVVANTGSSEHFMSQFNRLIQQKTVQVRTLRLSKRWPDKDWQMEKFREEPGHTRFPQNLLSSCKQMTFKYSQPVLPMLDNPLGEEKFPNIQSKPPLVQLEAISSCPITCYLGEETDPHLSTTSFQVVEKSDKVSPQPPFLQAKQSQLPQPLLIRLLLQTLHQLRCPSLHPLQYLNIPLVVGGPKLNTVFEVRPHQCRVQGHNHFPSPAGHAIFDTSQDAIGFLGRLGTLLAHIQAAVDQHPQVLLCQAAFQPLFPKPVALHGVAVAQVQDLALGLVKPHTIGLGPSIQPVQVPLQSLPPLQQINTPTQLGVVCKLTEGALDPLIQIIDKDVKQNWPQHRALGNTTGDRPPTGVNSIHHHSLGPAVQPVLYPVKSTPVQTMSSQFLQENAHSAYPVWGPGVTPLGIPRLGQRWAKGRSNCKSYGTLVRCESDPGRGSHRQIPGREDEKLLLDFAFERSRVAQHYEKGQLHDGTNSPQQGCFPRGAPKARLRCL
ncbi:hypothetical protein QYF61_017109 [Mycteria americana]|uniref:Uncharacterized protein n=1 Tax=Mycteria americana TaxID=33587 RepID=A0AAN7NBJ6_MYCAM|nr:hypothetical protein QYF61_017109 [Mycteria americana]